MKLGVDWSESSTKRNAIWVAGAAVGLVFYWFGKDPMPVMLMAASIAGGMGVAIKDKD